MGRGFHRIEDDLKEEWMGDVSGVESYLEKVAKVEEIEEARARRSPENPPKEV